MAVLVPLIFENTSIDYFMFTGGLILSGLEPGALGASVPHSKNSGHR